MGLRNCLATTCKKGPSVLFSFNARSLLVSLLLSGTADDLLRIGFRDRGMQMTY